jgi:aerobic C4-dicarboxylate transport protein
MKPLGDGFIKLIKMIIAPIIFCTVVVGIAGMEDMKKVGKTGGWRLLVLRDRQHPGPDHRPDHRQRAFSPALGMNVDPKTRSTPRAIAPTPRRGKMQGTVDFPAEHHPDQLVDAFAKGEILQVLLFAILFGFALHKLGGRGTLVFDVHREALACAVRHRRLIMKRRPHRRVWRHGVHHRQVRPGARCSRWRKLMGDLLPDLPGLHLSSCWASSRGSTGSASGSSSSTSRKSC